MAATAARPCPAATGKATYTQSRPRAAKAALCRAGDNEWVTGSPITPATRVLALGSQSPVAAQHRRAARHCCCS